MTEPIWVRMDVVLAVHKRQLAEHGGAEGIRDQGLLVSALSRPKNKGSCAKDKSDLASLAASYAFGIAKNHPFIDGNKRVAYVICRLFLRLNGVNIEATQEEKYLTFLKLAAGEINEAELAQWIRNHLTSC